MLTIQVKNMSAVMSQMNRIRHGFDGKDVGKVLLEEGGKPMRDRLRAAAPKGPTGNLRRAVQARIAREKALLTAVYVSVRRSIAHHLHLVTGGTKPHATTPTKKRAVYWGGIKGDRPVRSAQHPGAKPNDYFRQTWESYQSAIGDAITVGLGKLFDKAAR
jgi:hypothetical protein